MGHFNNYVKENLHFLLETLFLIEMIAFSLFF